MFRKQSSGYNQSRKKRRLKNHTIETYNSLVT